MTRIHTNQFVRRLYKWLVFVCASLYRVAMDDSVRDMVTEAREDAHKALRRAVTLAGGQTALGASIGVKQQNISYWLTKRHPSPAEYVLPIEAATGVSRHDLRPDLYPREDGPARPPAAQVADAAGGSPSACDSNALAGLRA